MDIIVKQQKFNTLVAMPVDQSSLQQNQTISTGSDHHAQKTMFAYST